MKCSECGEGLRDGDKFCIRCGAGVETAAAAREAASEPEACSRCGAALIPGDRFCKECGASVGAGIAEKKTSRLSAPIDTKYEAVEPSPVAAAPEVVAGPAARTSPRSTPKQSNRTFYQLLGLALVLIACGYLAYDYFVTPRHQGTFLAARQETGEAAQEAAAATAPGTAGGLPPATPQTQRPAAVSQVPTASGLAADVRTTPAVNPAPNSPPNSAPRKSVQPAPVAKQAAAQVRPAPRVDAPASAPPVAVPAAAPSLPAAPVASPAAAPPKVVASSPPPPSQPQQQPNPGTVLLPGSQAWKPPSKTAAPQAAATAPAPNRPAVITAPAPPPPPAANEGIIYWTGKLEKNKVVVIENGQVNMGQVSGNLFTGIPVDVHLPSPAVALVERPTAQNNWRRVAFRCLRNTDGSVTINIQWNLLR